MTSGSRCEFGLAAVTAGRNKSVERKAAAFAGNRNYLTRLTDNFRRFAKSGNFAAHDLPCASSYGGDSNEKFVNLRSNLFEYAGKMEALLECLVPGGAKSSALGRMIAARLGCVHRGRIVLWFLSMIRRRRPSENAVKSREA